jgi:hypothetical protein
MLHFLVEAKISECSELAASRRHAGRDAADGSPKINHAPQSRLEKAAMAHVIAEATDRQATDFVSGQHSE